MREVTATRANRFQHALCLQLAIYAALAKVFGILLKVGQQAAHEVHLTAVQQVKQRIHAAHVRGYQRLPRCNFKVDLSTSTGRECERFGTGVRGIAAVEPEAGL